MRYIDADKLKKNLTIPSASIIEIGKAVTAQIDDQPTADVVEVGKWCDMKGCILEIQADENGYNEFFRIIKMTDELKERVANEIEEAIIYGADMRGGQE